MVDGTDIVADENSNDEDLCKEKADKEMTDSPTHNKPVDDVCFNSSNMLDSTGNGTHNGSPQPQEVISPNSEDLGHPLSFSKAAVRRTAKEAITTQNETQNTTSTDNATGTDNTTGTDTTATQRLSADYVETLSRCTGVFLLYLAGALQETSQRSTRNSKQPLGRVEVHSALRRIGFQELTAELDSTHSLSQPVVPGTETTPNITDD
eukprot:Lankesteria_metandrocarpae@DN4808_c0_g1_i1.p1